MDPETQKILGEKEQIKSLIGHEGWPIVRDKFTNKIMELQNAFSIETDTPEKMVMDLGARKMASLIMFDFLRDIEGTATEADDYQDEEDESPIIRLDK